MKKLHGVRLAHHKNTENCASVPLPLPKLVRIPMSMHIGAPCTPAVKPRDTVLVGAEDRGTRMPLWQHPSTPACPAQ